MTHNERQDGESVYTVKEIDRSFPIIFIGILFAVAILIFGGRQGLRSLISLAGSIFIIIYLLIPTLAKGYSPIFISTIAASAVLFFAIFLTHGFNKRSFVAFCGTIIAVSLTGLLAFFAIDLASLTGLASDESVYLNLNTGGELNFEGLLLAAIIIGSLGVLDDIAVTQVAVVRELVDTKNNLARFQIYKKALRVGKEHVGALVNTLVLAYTGAALSLLLLFSKTNQNLSFIINKEIFATEIIRSLIGSIGLVLAVPITTLLAVFLIHKQKESQDS